MNIFSNPIDWRDLQRKVHLLLTQIGLKAEIEKTLSTPRGNVEVDVYAIDTNSVDQISYIIECKNWNQAVNQSIIHAFTTVMHETGGDIGYIISKKGFQAGAKEYSRYTNIRLFTFDDFQKHYLKIWLIKYFSKKLGDALYKCNQYCEPINSYRDRLLNTLNKDCQSEYYNLVRRYETLFFELRIIENNIKEGNMGDYTQLDWSIIIKEFERIGFSIKDSSLNSIIEDIYEILETISSQFDEIFGKNIFGED